MVTGRADDLGEPFGQALDQQLVVRHRRRVHVDADGTGAVVGEERGVHRRADGGAEGGIAGDQPRRIAIARKPVFSIGTLAMVVTMIAAILGASVDRGALPPMVHAMIAYGAIACNLAALKIEIAALSESSRIVDEVNRLLGA